MTEIPHDNAQLRPFKPSDLPAMQQLSAQQGWPHRLQDWQRFRRLGEFRVLEFNHKVVGCGAALNQGSYWSIALVIVDNQLQGQGLGRMIFQALLDVIAHHSGRPDTPVTLTATAAGSPMYRKFGFTTHSYLQQWQGHWQTAIVNESAPLLEADKLRQSLSHVAGIEQPSMLDALMQCQGLALKNENGNSDALGLLRDFGRGSVIGPVVAENLHRAEKIILGLASHLPKERPFLRLDIPEDCGLQPLLSEQGLEQVDRLEVMWRHKPPQSDIPHGRTFAIFSQATGLPLA